MNYYFDVLKKYTTFSGRARRKEYWYFILFNTIIYILIGIISGLLGSKINLFSQIYALAVLLPSIAVSVRRMHDVGKSGWYILMPIYNIVLLFTDSIKGDNKYGKNPKGISFPSSESDETVHVPKNENEINIFIENNKTLFKSPASVVFYSIIFIISFLLSVIIPFMYVTLIQPMPVKPDSISVLNLFSFINIVNVIIYTIVFLILRIKDFNEVGHNFISKLRNYEMLPKDDQIYLLNNSLRTYYKLKNVMLIVLFIPFWSSFIVSFMHVTGPLVLSHKIYYLNNIFLALYLIFIVLFFPTSKKAIEYHKNSFKLS